jgi:hypothetical protein
MAANGRYLKALAAVHSATPLRRQAKPLCRHGVRVAPRRILLKARSI